MKPVTKLREQVREMIREREKGPMKKKRRRARKKRNLSDLSEVRCLPGITVGEYLGYITQIGRVANLKSSWIFPKIFGGNLHWMLTRGNTPHWR